MITVPASWHTRPNYGHPSFCRRCERQSESRILDSPSSATPKMTSKYSPPQLTSLKLSVNIELLTLREAQSTKKKQNSFKRTRGNQEEKKCFPVFSTFRDTKPAKLPGNCVSLRASDIYLHV